MSRHSMSGAMLSAVFHRSSPVRSRASSAGATSCLAGITRCATVARLAWGFCQLIVGRAWAGYFLMSVCALRCKLAYINTIAMSLLV